MNPGILTNLLRSGLVLGAVSIFALPQSAWALPDIKIASYDLTNKVVTVDGASFDPATSVLYVNGTLVSLQSATENRLTTVPTSLFDGTHELLLVDSTGDDIHMLAVSSQPGVAGPQGPAGPQGARGMVYRGPWSLNVNYVIGDYVTYSGVVYVAKVNHRNGGTPNVATGCWAPFSVTVGVGPQGPIGPQGVTGAKGKTGAIGPVGAKGLTGTTGATGPKGDNGAIGSQGLKGETGMKGETGAVGPQGPKGDIGLKGDKGETGVAGGPGENGKDGAVGPQGSKGETGMKGETGAVGPQGTKGDTGAKGDAGVAGVPGERGENGKDGAAGPQGPKGDTGPIGSQGSKGDTGSVGPQGVKGDTGLKGDTGAKGDAGSVGPQGVRGETGAVGPQGLKGDIGTQGPVGLVGPQGSAGAKGETGAAGKDAAPGNTIIGGGTGNANSKLDVTKVNYIPMFDSNVDVSEANIVQVMPASGTVSHFYVRLNENSSNKGKGYYVFTVRKNGKDTEVSCTIGTGGKDPNGLTGSDLDHSIDFVEGDTISISSTPTDNPTPVAMRWTARY